MQTVLTIFSQPPTLSEGASAPSVESCAEFSLGLETERRELKAGTEIKADCVSPDCGWGPGVSLPTGPSVGAYRIDRVLPGDGQDAVGAVADSPVLSEAVFAQPGQPLPTGPAAGATDGGLVLSNHGNADDDALDAAALAQPNETVTPAHVTHERKLRVGLMGTGQLESGTAEGGLIPFQPDPGAPPESANIPAIMTGGLPEGSRPFAQEGAGVPSLSVGLQNLGRPARSQNNAANPRQSNDAHIPEAQKAVEPDPIQLQGSGPAAEPATATFATLGSGPNTLSPDESRTYVAATPPSASGMLFDANRLNSKASRDLSASEEPTAVAGEGPFLPEAPGPTSIRPHGARASVWEGLFPGLSDARPQIKTGSEHAGTGFVDLPLVETPVSSDPHSVSPAQDPEGQSVLPEPGVVAGKEISSTASAGPKEDSTEPARPVHEATPKASGRPTLRTEPAGAKALGLMDAVQFVDLQPGQSDNPAQFALSGAPLTGSSAARPVHGAVASAIQVPQLAAQMNAALTQSRFGETELALSPDELGHVRLKLKPDAANPDRMVVLITFERPETLDLFRRHAGELADALRSAGYAGADIGFGQEGGSPSGSGQNEGFVGHRFESNALPEPTVATPSAPRLAAGVSLDLRL